MFAVASFFLLVAPSDVFFFCPILCTTTQQLCASPWDKCARTWSDSAFVLIDSGHWSALANGLRCFGNVLPNHYSAVCRCDLIICHTLQSQCALDHQPLPVHRVFMKTGLVENHIWCQTLYFFWQPWWYWHIFSLSIQVPKLVCSRSVVQVWFSYGVDTAVALLQLEWQLMLPSERIWTL